jgi:arylsulfatase A
MVNKLKSLREHPCGDISVSMFLIRFLRLLLLLVALISCRAAERPNIVFILADDLGINDLACYGRKEHHTPNLDRLAAEGMRFTQSYCAQSICSPSRAAILTGKAPARLHLTTYLPGRADAPSQKLLHPKIEQQLPLSEVTLAERLKEGGYVSACIGKWHLGGKGFLPTDQGFDFYHAGQANTTPSETEGGKGEQDLTTQAIQFMAANTNRPFFLYLAHNAPHIPYAARAKRVANNARALEPVYAAVIEELDDSVGRLVAALDQLGLREKTLVIFTSDNGGLHVPEGTHKTITHNTPYRAGKGFLYEGGLRVPLIARWPGKTPTGKIVEMPVINTDWTPTVCALAGVEVSGLDGIDNSALLLGYKVEAVHRVFHWHFPHYTNQGSQPAGAVRDGDWKLIQNYDDGKLELYNLADDVSETTNLVERESARTSEMLRSLEEWRGRMNVQTNSPNPKFKRELYEELYVKIVPSLYNASTATKAQWEEMQAWRARMDAALRP